MWLTTRRFGDCVHRAGAHAVDRDRHRAAGALRRRRLQHEFVRRLVDRPAVLPAVVFVGHELAVGVDAGAHVGEVRRAVVVPAVLVGAHELHAHRLADRLRHDGRGLRRVLVAAAAEGARAFDILHAHLALTGRPSTSASMSREL